MDVATWLVDPQFVGWWFLTGLLCAAWVAADELLTNRRVDRPLRVAWPFLVLLWSLPGVLAYVAISRPLGLERLGRDELDRHRRVFAGRRWRRVVGATVAAAGTGGVAFVLTVAALRLAGAELWAQLAVGYTVAFVLVAGLSQELLLRRRSRAAAAAWARATFVGVIAVLMGVAGAALLLAPRAAVAGSPLTAPFWSVAVAALAAGAVAALPVHWLLVRRRWAEGVA